MFHQDSKLDSASYTDLLIENEGLVVAEAVNVTHLFNQFLEFKNFIISMVNSHTFWLKNKWNGNYLDVLYLMRTLISPIVYIVKITVPPLLMSSTHYFILFIQVVFRKLNSFRITFVNCVNLSAFRWKHLHCIIV